MSMKSSDPDWYASLRQDPFKDSTFTYELAAKIQKEAGLLDRGKLGLRRLLLGAAGVIFAMGMLWMAKEQGAFGFMADPAAATSSASGTAPSPAAASSKTLTDSEWQSFVDSNSGKEEYKEVLYRKSLREDAMLVFSKRLVQYPNIKLPILEADLFIWDSKQSVWKQTTSGTYALPYDDIMNGTPEKLVTARFGFGEDASFYFGVVTDPRTSEIVVTDRDKAQHSAIKVRNKDGYTYWIAVLSRQRGINKVQSMDASGNVLTEDQYYTS